MVAAMVRSRSRVLVRVRCGNGADSGEECCCGGCDGVLAGEGGCVIRSEREVL